MKIAPIIELIKSIDLREDELDFELEVLTNFNSNEYSIYNSLPNNIRLETFGNLIASILEKSKITIQDLAIKADCPENMISNLVNDKMVIYEFPARIFLNILDVLSLSVERIENCSFVSFCKISNSQIMFSKEQSKEVRTTLFGSNFETTDINEKLISEESLENFISKIKLLESRNN